MISNKKEKLISIIVNDNCPVECIGCEECPLAYSNLTNTGCSNSVEVAKQLFIEEYGKEKLFEVLL